MTNLGYCEAGAMMSYQKLEEECYSDKRKIIFLWFYIQVNTNIRKQHGCMVNNYISLIVKSKGNNKKFQFPQKST